MNETAGTSKDTARQFLWEAIIKAGLPMPTPDCRIPFQDEFRATFGWPAYYLAIHIDDEPREDRIVTASYPWLIRIWTPGDILSDTGARIADLRRLLNQPEEEGVSEPAEHPIDADYRRPCPRCGAPMFKGESGSAIGSVTGGSVRHLWRWCCPQCHYHSQGWDGYRVTATYMEYGRREE